MEHACKDTPVVTDNGEIVCPACCIVLGFAEYMETRPVATGRKTNPKYFDDGLGSTRMDDVPAPLKRVALYAQAGKKTTLSGPLRNISNICSKIGLPEPVAVDAALAYRRIRRVKHITFCPRGVLPPACVFWACRRANLPKTLSEIASVAGLEKNDVFRAYYRLLKLNPAPEPPEANRLVAGIATKLNLRPIVERQAVNIISKLPPAIATGRSPRTIAATAVFLAVGDATITVVADAAGISPTPIYVFIRAIKDDARGKTGGLAELAALISPQHALNRPIRVAPAKADKRRPDDSQ